MTRGDASLKGVGTWRIAQMLGSLKRLETPPNQQPIPPGPVLLIEPDRPAGRVYPRIQP
jgi:hypothetical protein